MSQSVLLIKQRHHDLCLLSLLLILEICCGTEDTESNGWGRSCGIWGQTLLLLCLYIIRPHLSSLDALYVWVPAPGGGAQLEERSARVISALVTGGSTRATEPLLENKYIFGSVRSSRSHNV